MREGRGSWEAISGLWVDDGRDPASSKGAFPSIDAGGRQYIATPEGFLEV